MQMTFIALIIKTFPYSIAAKSWFSEVKLCSRNSQITYLKADSTFKKFGVICTVMYYFLSAILLLPLIQEEQLSVTGERMCTKYW